MDIPGLTLFSYILMRMSGFVLFNPIFGRRGIPGIVKSGFVMVLTVAVFFTQPAQAPEARGMLEYALRMLLELGLGYGLGLVMNLFFYVVILAGEVIDTQLGMNMSKTYDPSSQSSLSLSATLMNIMMMLLFFAAGGHLTLLRIMTSSAQLIPYGAAQLGTEMASGLVELFIECCVLALKLAMPILAAEIMGQVGMGILMKVIPQINVFAINLELKILVGLTLMMLLIYPMGNFLIGMEADMLGAVRRLLEVSG